MIPKIIWQTYKVPISELPEYALAAVGSWKSMNPSWEHRYMDDEAAAEFVLAEYGEEWHRIFTGCPIGVMKADLWRYLVVYRHGGVYADLDTVCKAPIDLWLDPDAKMLVATEHANHLCQWTFAAEPGHPVLKSVLDTVFAGFQNPDYSNPDFVHILTGPDVWTRGIFTAIGYAKQSNLVEEIEAMNASSEAQRHGLVVHEDPLLFRWHAVQHLFGSQVWSDGNYVRWIEDRKRVNDGERLM